MVTEIKQPIGGNEDMRERRILEDIDFLQQAVMNPNGPERAILNQIVRDRGFADLQSLTLRNNAKVLLARYGNSLGAPSRVLLLRFSIGRGEQPAGREYTGVDSLCLDPRSVQDAAPDDIARSGVRMVSEIYEYLLHLPQLENHPDRVRLEARVGTVISHCASLGFGPAPWDDLNPDAPDSNAVVHGAMLPESGIPDELLFQATTQSSEVVFNLGHILIQRAAHRIVHDQAALAAVDLHYASITLQLLMPILSTLASMTVETWLKVRTYIDRPGAVQSLNYRELRMGIGEIERIIDLPRYPKHEKPRVPWVAEAFSDVVANLSRWRAAHAGIARKYTPTGSDGLLWLTREVAEVIQDRRAPKKESSAEETASRPSVNEGPSAEGRCPFGY